MITTTAVEIDALVRRWRPLFHLLEKMPLAEYRPPEYIQNGQEPFFHPRETLRKRDALALSVRMPPAGKYRQVLLLTTGGELVVCAYSDHGLYFHLVNGDLHLYAPEPDALCTELVQELRRLRKTAARRLESEFGELLPHV